jgi:hypothetical protein
MPHTRLIRELISVLSMCREGEASKSLSDLRNPGPGLVLQAKVTTLREGVIEKPERMTSWKRSN